MERSMRMRNMVWNSMKREKNMIRRQKIMSLKILSQIYGRVRAMKKTTKMMGKPKTEGKSSQSSLTMKQESSKPLQKRPRTKIPRTSHKAVMVLDKV